MIGQRITAADGKVFRRISDGMQFGHEIYLGMAYPKDGEPYEELPEHFEEIDDPLDRETVVLDEETPLVEELPEPDLLPEEQAEETDKKEVKQAVTIADYRELERKVELLMKLMGGTE